MLSRNTSKEDEKSSHLILAHFWAKLMLKNFNARQDMRNRQKFFDYKCI